MTETAARNLLLIGDSKTAGLGVVRSRFVNFPYEYAESPTRIATSGWTAADVATNIDAALAAATGTPNHILVNIGANDVGALPAEATWKADVNYFIDALNTKYAGVQIYMMRPWRRSYGTESDAVADWIGDIVAANSSVHLGPDERVFLENGDDGATYTSDGLHPNDAGYQLTGKQWASVL